ncbi:MAG TPA: hypothetical protein VKA34_04220 [Balneolales bacterium]|nr:hypothetical protein [Balneolales bacterium]
MDDLLYQLRPGKGPGKGKANLPYPHRYDRSDFKQVQTNRIHVPAGGLLCSSGFDQGLDAAKKLID